TESVEVFDVNGRVHYSGQGATLHVSEWIEGVYTVRYKLKDQYVTERLVVTHL
ncbi:MAG: T9SS type A sorting domain-containing protein, partial [Bacteroidetes bacterium]